MKRILPFLFSFCVTALSAQVPEDGLRYSWFPQNASARLLGAGGIGGSVGGDLSVVYTNPAGLGFYRVSEAVISPGYSFIKANSSYRGTSNNADRNALSFGPSGIIIAAPQGTNSRKNDALSISFTRSANFSSLRHYKGFNNYSSFSEQLAEEFSASGQSIDDALNTNSFAPYTVAPALYTYLVDTVTINGTTIVKGAPEYVLDQGKALLQEKLQTSKGGLYELNFAYGANEGEKLLWGVAIGIPIIHYESNTVFTEADTSADNNNHFNSFRFTDNFTTKGAGINGRVGVIYRPKEYVRFGLALHSPSFMALTDSRETTLETSLESPAFDTTISSKLFTNGERGKARYGQTSPWRALLSASYVFRETADVTRQRGFISADAEYVNHRGSRFSSNAEEPTDADKDYYKALNNVVKDIYKGAFNFRIGGELKFKTIMARLGFGHYGNPYKDAPVKAGKTTLSGGLGYRDKGFFVDLAYVYLITKDFDIPYRLESRQNTFADIKETGGTIAITVGMKF